jgi:hypothetical protein
MPKDATKNVDRYKIRGGQLNEFEYTENQKAVTEKKPKGRAKLIPGTPPEEAGDGSQPAVKAISKAAKSTKGTKKKANNSSTKGASPKKLAARKAASKKK